MQYRFPGNNLTSHSCKTHDKMFIHSFFGGYFAVKRQNWGFGQTWQEKHWGWKVRSPDLMTKAEGGIGWKQRAHWPPPKILINSGGNRNVTNRFGECKGGFGRLFSTCSNPAGSRCSRLSSRGRRVFAARSDTGCSAGRRRATPSLQPIGRSDRIPAHHNRRTPWGPGWTRLTGPETQSVSLKHTKGN